jgi:hypothetical protein
MKLSEIKQAKERLYDVAAHSLGLCYHEDNEISDLAKAINKNAHEVYDWLSQEEGLVENERREKS